MGSGKTHGRPKKTDWERCQEISRYVDRAMTKAEGSVEWKQSSDAAISIFRNTVNSLLTRPSITISDEVLVRRLYSIKSKIKELIKQL